MWPRAEVERVTRVTRRVATRMALEVEEGLLISCPEFVHFDGRRDRCKDCEVKECVVDYRQGVSVGQAVVNKYR